MVKDNAYSGSPQFKSTQLFKSQLYFYALNEAKGRENCCDPEESVRGDMIQG